MPEYWIEKNKKCYLCNSKGLVKFNEHYYFCPECSCIYTYAIIMESNCNHIQENHSLYIQSNYSDPVKEPIPTVIRDSWYKTIKDKVYIIEGEDDSQTCSICGAECIADGW